MFSLEILGVLNQLSYETSDSVCIYIYIYIYIEESLANESHIYI